MTDQTIAERVVWWRGA